ncbi:MAG: DUF2325 domain-containing protein [Pseudomonadota bacterium]
MCDRCENKGSVLTSLLAKAGVVSEPFPAQARPGAEFQPVDQVKRLEVTNAGSLSKAGRRPKLWELEEKHHCPVIGTCLSLEELQKIARKGGFPGKSFEPYRLHVEAVSISCSRNEMAEAMHKLLERKFSLDLAHFSRLRTDAEVLTQWKWHLERGEVAGPMWAALTHKVASKSTRDAIYADVHMLSHQVGAGQAADIRRLETLQKEHAELRAAHGALKGTEREVALTRQALEREVNGLRTQVLSQAEEMAALRTRLQTYESGQAIVALGRRLLMAEAQAARSTELEVRLKALEQRTGMLRADKVRLTRELDETCAERDALERLWGVDGPAADDPAGADRTCAGECGQCDQRLKGRCVLCVGGRVPLLPQYRQLAERLGVRLIHHDGGREEALARLPELLNASDAVICPTDCVGHLAYYQLKKHCKQSGKPCVLAKRSGVAGFAAALARLAEGRADIHTQT